MTAPLDADATPFSLVTLRGGARAVRHAAGEVMHPSVGPWAEAQALYVHQSRLAQLLEEPGDPLVLHDVGLGAAANLAAAMAAARALGPARRRPLHVATFERDLRPLALALGDPAGFPFLAPIAAGLARLMDGQVWDEDGVRVRLHHGDVLGRLDEAEGPADLVFFDPFSPRLNPSLWTPEALGRLRARCRGDGAGAALYTYSAATPTRVALLLAGFFVGVGDPIGDKRETTAAATSPARLTRPLDRRWLERWRRSSARRPHGHPDLPLDELEARLLAHPQLA